MWAQINFVKSLVSLNDLDCLDNDIVAYRHAAHLPILLNWLTWWATLKILC